MFATPEKPATGVNKMSLRSAEMVKIPLFLEVIRLIVGFKPVSSSMSFSVTAISCSPPLTKSYAYKSGVEITFACLTVTLKRVLVGIFPEIE